jgi:DNA-binding MarR family transcriptional regulator
VAAAFDPERFQAWRSMHRAHEVVRRQVEVALAEWLPLPWFEILQELHAAGGSRRALELAESLMVNKSSLTRQLDRMEEAGFLRRERGADDDGRAVTVTLTRDGRDLHRRAVRRYQSVIRRAFSTHLTDTDLTAIQRVTGKILEGD